MIFLSQKTLKKAFSAGAKGQAKGQAIVEYVLILTVLVVVGGGLLLQFNKGIEAWGKTLLGTNGHIACLLQTGLLPHQASSQGSCPSLADAGAEFDKASTDNKPDLKGGGGGGPGGSSSGDGSDSSSDNNKGQDSGNNSNAGNDSSSSGGGDSSRRNGRKNTGYNPNGNLMALNTNQLSNSNAQNKDGLVYKTKKRKPRKMKAKLSSSEGKFDGYNQNKGGGQLYSALQFGGGMSEDEDLQNRSTPLRAPASAGAKNNALKPKKPMFLPKRLKKNQNFKEKSGGWSFGNIFRVALIALIIAVVAFLIFNQANSVRKSLK